MAIDLANADELLSTTRAVRKRLDFAKPVPRQVILDCIRLSQQAPTASNSQTWRWVVVDDAAKRKQIADIYRAAAGSMLADNRKQAEAQGEQQTAKVYASAEYLSEHLHEAPVHVIPCLMGRPYPGHEGAYFASISYVDRQVGVLMQALKESGLEDNTVVMLTADHGDMLGERGLWYKMTWFENACRIPLIVSAPGKFKSGRITTNASHLDLLPTLAEIANDGGAFQPAAEIDGKSLLGALSGGTGHDEAIGEYCGEGAIAPLVMIRRANWKFMHTPSDPDQLYDLKADPLEKQNLAADAKHAATVEAFRKEVKQRWDLAKLKEQVIDSQRRRRIVYEALSKGRHRSWDYQPIRDAGTAYMRNNVVLDDLEARTRLPRVG